MNSGILSFFSTVHREPLQLEARHRLLERRTDSTRREWCHLWRRCPTRGRVQGRARRGRGRVASNRPTWSTQRSRCRRSRCRKSWWISRCGEPRKRTICHSIRGVWPTIDYSLVRRPSWNGSLLYFVGYVLTQVVKTQCIHRNRIPTRLL